MSRDIVFYVTIFPFAAVPKSSISDSNSLGSDTFVFPHCVSGSSYPFPPSHLVQPSFTTSAVPNTADTSNAGPAPISSIDIPALTSISGCNSETGLIPSPVTRVLPVLHPRKSTRAHNPPSYLRDYSCNAVFSTPASGSPYDISDFLTFTHLNKAYKHFVFDLQATPTEPTSFHQAVQSPEWRTAMDKEIQALELNNTWISTHLPLGKIPIGCKWIYRIKYHSDGTIERYKARLVAKGYTQREGLDYTDTFTLVAKSVSIRIMLSMADVKGWGLHQMDVNNAFLHGDLNEEVYMSLPQGFHSKGESPNLVCKLKNSLYGLKQTSRQWFAKFSYTILNFGFVQSKDDYSLFTYAKGSSFIVLLV